MGYLWMTRLSIARLVACLCNVVCTEYPRGKYALVVLCVLQEEYGTINMSYIAPPLLSMQETLRPWRLLQNAFTALRICYSTDFPRQLPS
jgi:hypothetical protein